MNHQDLIPFIERFSNAKVLCVGDVMLDHFIYGDVNRISPEAPIPVVRVSHERSMLGGAGNVVRNLSSLGAQTVLLTVVGADSSADLIGKELNGLAELRTARGGGHGAQDLGEDEVYLGQPAAAASG